MGKKIENTDNNSSSSTEVIEEFLKVLQSTRSRLVMTVGQFSNYDKSKRTYKHISEAAGQNDNLRIQRDFLKCYVGGYVFIDPIRMEVTPLFGDSDQVRGEPAYPLEYVWDNEILSDSDKKQYEKIIDGMFLCWRFNETIKHYKSESDGESNLVRKYYRPEYIYHLPLFYRRFCYARNVHEYEKSAVKNEYFECLYCSMGETAFYIYAWRFLFRSYVQYGAHSSYGNCNMVLGEDTFENNYYKVNSSWSKNIWTNPELREKHLIDYLADRNISDSTAWSDSNDFCHEIYPTRKLWVNDWELMLLAKWQENNSNIEIGPSLLPLIKYSIYINDCLKNIERKEKLESWYENLKNSANQEIQALKSLDKLLQETVCEFFSHDDDCGSSCTTVESLLCNLHKRVRFPVLPYYYWIAFDKTQRTHFVIPIFSSNTNPIKISLQGVSEPLYNSFSDSDYFQDIAEFGIIGVTVTGVKPLRNIDWTLGDQQGYFDEDGIRMSSIIQYYEMFSNYIVDDWFFRLLKNRDRYRIEEVVMDAQHRINNPLGIIVNAKNTIQRRNNPAKVRDKRTITKDYSDVVQELRYGIKLIKYYLEIMQRSIPSQKVLKTNIKNDVLSKLVRDAKEYYKCNIKQTPGDKYIDYSAYIDRNALFAILMELIHNAHKFRRNDVELEISIDVTVSYIKSIDSIEKKDKEIRIEVSDNGSGIKKEIKDKVFNRGFTTKKRTSTGFGLFRVKELTENYLLGTIKLIDTDERIQEGSKFQVRFPSRISGVKNGD